MRAVEKFYNVTETAMLLSLGNETVLKRLKAGEFGGECVNLAGGSERPDYRIPASAINAYLERRRVFVEPGIAARTTGELRRKASRQPEPDSPA